MKTLASLKYLRTFAPLLTKSTSDKEVLERWQSGRLRRSWKPLYCEVPGVRIPVSPLESSFWAAFLFLWRATPPMSWNENGSVFLVFIEFFERRDARVVEEARLESVYTPKVYRGFESRSLRWTCWTEMVSKRTKSYKSMICGFFYCPKVLLPRLQKYGKRQSFVTKSLPIPRRTKTVTICP